MWIYGFKYYFGISKNSRNKIKRPLKIPKNLKIIEIGIKSILVRVKTNP